MTLVPIKTYVLFAKKECIYNLIKRLVKIPVQVDTIKMMKMEFVILVLIFVKYAKMETHVKNVWKTT